MINAKGNIYVSCIVIKDLIFCATRGITMHKCNFTVRTASLKGSYSRQNDDSDPLFITNDTISSPYNRYLLNIVANYARIIVLNYDTQGLCRYAEL